MGRLGSRVCLDAGGRPCDAVGWGQRAATSSLPRGLSCYPIEGFPRRWIAGLLPLWPRQWAEVMLGQADQLRDAGKHNEALWAYRRLINQYPMTPAAATARGRIVQLWNTVRFGQR